jgi:hypothetical protein
MIQNFEVNEECKQCKLILDETYQELRSKNRRYKEEIARLSQEETQISPTPVLAVPEERNLIYSTNLF